MPEEPGSRVVRFGRFELLADTGSCAKMVSAWNCLARLSICLVDPHGGVPRKLDIDIRGNSLPSWSHGNWIYFVNGNDPYHATGWKVPCTGGHAVPITQGKVWLPVESPDGRSSTSFANGGCGPSGVMEPTKNS